MEIIIDYEPPFLK